MTDIGVGDPAGRALARSGGAAAHSSNVRANAERANPNERKEGSVKDKGRFIGRRVKCYNDVNDVYLAGIIEFCNPDRFSYIVSTRPPHLNMTSSCLNPDPLRCVLPPKIFNPCQFLAHHSCLFLHSF